MRSAIGPAPGGEQLVLTIECTVTPADQFGVPHIVAVLPDWSVKVPHDLEAERVAAVFGGWSSCERFASAAVPAYRRMVEVMSGATELHRTPGGSWATSRAPGCCTPPSVFASRFEAVLHESGPSHLAAAFGTTAQAMRVVAAAGRRAWSQAADPSLLDGGEAGYRELWDRGVHPERVVRLVHALPDGVSPLPVATYVEAERRDIDALVAGAGRPVDRSEAAVMLAPEPSRHRVLAALCSGVRSAAEMRQTRCC